MSGLSKTELRAIVATTMHLLGEDPTPKTLAWWHYNFVCRELGQAATEELIAIIARGPEGPRTRPVWLKEDGSARSPGGVFFALARARLTRSRWKCATFLAHDCFKKSQAKAKTEAA